MPFPLPGTPASSHPYSACDSFTFFGHPGFNPGQKNQLSFNCTTHRLEHQSYGKQVPISQSAPAAWPDCWTNQSQFLMQVFVLGKQHKQMEREHKEGATGTGGESVGWLNRCVEVNNGKWKSHSFCFPRSCHPCRLTIIWRNLELRQSSMR